VEFLKQYEILITKAKEDFVAANYLLDGYNNHNLELKLEIIYFHLQQCAEKSIKSLLDFKNIKFPHTHDIEELINILNENNIKISNGIEKLTDLTEFTVDGRYAVVHDDLDDAEKYIDILKQLALHVEKVIKEEEI